MPGQPSPVTHSVCGLELEGTTRTHSLSESESELDGTITDLSDEEEIVTMNDKQKIKKLLLKDNSPKTMAGTTLSTLDGRDFPALSHAQAMLTK